MMYQTPENEIQKTENEIFSLIRKLETLRKEAKPIPVKNYELQDLFGNVTLLDLFAGKDRLLAIHNMGQGCRYCTLWADGLNGFVPHLESAFSVVLLSKDSVEVQRRFANARQWRFRMASHGGGEYIREQSIIQGDKNTPGVVLYERKGNEIFRKNASVFGPGDLFCSQWSLLSLAGVGLEEWTPQFSYWKRPEKLEDGGDNIL
jgi:predicted dithiol-disulfide oxidoreductase (DUF899 family)